ncbi:DUF2313 domain-containing protein [Salmonella enterica]|nr:DUF2313 domain-containing protein [Salmonella enterica]
MSRYTRTEYLSAIASLMPTGKAWPKKSGTVQQAVLAALASSCVRSDRAATGLLRASFPPTATDFLTEWEKSLGLPDDCGISETGVGVRQQAILAKLAFSGGQSAQFYISLAKSMGYEISLNVFRQARTGLSHCGDALNGDDWPACMEVLVDDVSYIAARCRANYCGDPLRVWGNRRLVCTINRQAQSHTAVLFHYLRGITLSAENTLIQGEVLYPDHDLSDSGVTVEVEMTNMDTGDFVKKYPVTDGSGRFSCSVEGSGRFGVIARARFMPESYGPVLLSSETTFITINQVKETNEENR